MLKIERLPSRYHYFSNNLLNVYFSKRLHKTVHNLKQTRAAPFLQCCPILFIRFFADAQRDYLTTILAVATPLSVVILTIYIPWLKSDTSTVAALANVLLNSPLTLYISPFT